ncbi:MAG: hypothetical protein ACRD28_14575 [Acidobacteriaceae bacterium]
MSEEIYALQRLHRDGPAGRLGFGSPGAFDKQFEGGIRLVRSGKEPIVNGQLTPGSDCFSSDGQETGKASMEVR